MPGHLTLLLGLAGSGKTWMVDHVLRYDKKYEESFMDGPKHRSLVGHLQEGKRCIVSERNFLSQSNREAFVNGLQGEVPGVIVTYLCFENDVAAANANCRRENHKNDPEGHVKMNDGDTLFYEIPAEAIVLKIHRLVA